MKRVLKFSVAALLVAIVIAISLYFYLPINRVDVTSELVMLGDLNNDNKWGEEDLVILNEFLREPFSKDRLTHLKIDLNKNGLIDSEDIAFLKHIVKYPNPYEAEQKADSLGVNYPKPRELFHYLPSSEYIQRPLFQLSHDVVESSPLTFLQEINIISTTSAYEQQLLDEIYNEGVRFSLAYSKRKPGLTQVENSYVKYKIAHCENLFQQKDYYELLLNLISLVEDGETLTTKTQSDFIKKVLYFRDHLQELIVSDDFNSFAESKIKYQEIFKKIEENLESDLGISLDLASLSSPRDFSNLDNYLDRAEWQIYKSRTTQEDFKKLVLYAQYDHRYLRAVSKTTPKFQDLQLQNHNLPMILLFREALRITNNDKKAALGLLDEAVRIPMGWVKSIPKDILPSSIALENFLLPGNKEDGSDKTRHWNVFGGVAIYKSPEESLVLSLKREIMDLRSSNYSTEAMQEFIRDTIANINGIYYVVSIDPDLLKK